MAASITSQLPTNYPNYNPPGTALASTNTKVTNENLLRHQRPITSNARHMRNPLGEVVPSPLLRDYYHERGPRSEQRYTTQNNVKNSP